MKTLKKLNQKELNQIDGGFITTIHLVKIAILLKEASDFLTK